MLRKYPTKKYGLQMRSFNSRWYEQYTWLEYSVTMDGLFCFACRHFAHEGRRFHKETAFTHDGFSTWVKAKQSFLTHDVSGGHKYAMDAWSEFKLRKESGSKISNALSEGHSRTVCENREYVRAAVEALRYTACQPITQRGHGEGEASRRGNFSGLLDLIGKFDKTVAKTISDSPRNAKCSHLDIHEELTELMSQMARDQMSGEVQEAGAFALMVDESRDASGEEQVSVAVRYMHNDGIREELLHLAPADGLDADSLFTAIRQTLRKCNIDHNMCVGQSYDGAAALSGRADGVPERLRQEVPQALYVHGHAHRLHLVLVDCVKHVRPAGEFFEVVRMLYSFLSGSVVHSVFHRKQKELEPTEQPVELRKLSDARCACQYSALCAIQKTLPAIYATLDEVITQGSARGKTGARAVKALIDAHFAVHLTLFEDVFRATKLLSDYLQSSDLHLASATALVESVITSLSGKRNDKSWNEIVDKARALSTKTGILLQSRHEPRQPQPASHREGCDAPPAPLTSSEDIREHCYYPALDSLVSEMKRRFSSESCGVLRGACALNPTHESFLEMEHLSPMAQYYGVNTDNLSAELHQVRRLLGRTEQQQGRAVNTTRAFLSLLRPYKDAFIDLHRLVCISVTLPVTPATCGRSFSCLRRVKDFMRSNSGDSRNSHLALLSVNAERARALDDQEVIDAFALNHNNRCIVLL
ncbi:hypothetical protein KUCAC02_033046 [Chaenocephalus aceratus]|nr:hypothetical protein KUCAC02_033046 [Chaenocephalus aceratus]